jgi:hypothetical protein
VPYLSSVALCTGHGARLSQVEYCRSLTSFTTNCALRQFFLLDSSCLALQLHNLVFTGTYSLFWNRNTFHRWFAYAKFLS